MDLIFEYLPVDRGFLLLEEGGRAEAPDEPAEVLQRG